MSRYGPHDPSAAPDSVLVLEAKRWPARAGVVVPLPPGLVAQRRHLNELAHAAEHPRMGGRGWWPCPCGLWHPGGVECPEGGDPS